MTITFSKISSIFSDFLENSQAEKAYEDETEKLIYLNIKTNKIIWDLEDSARRSELGDTHIAEAKKNIDTFNQQRNNLIKEIDGALYNLLGVVKGSPDAFYCESPGMLIDRLSIIFIKRSIVKKLISLIKEADLKSEYARKEEILERQIENIGNFLDLYIERLIKKEVFFEIQQPVKIYNDTRVKEYIKFLSR